MSNIFQSQLINNYISENILLEYEKVLSDWLNKYNMNNFFGTADHFAIKTKNEKDFEELVSEFEQYCVDSKDNTPGLSVRKMHGRRIAVALLSEPISFMNNKIDCIEIMQPRPEAEGADIVGLDHLEIINSNLKEIENSLKTQSANYYIDETNPYKEIVVSFVNEKKVRIKFTNRTLEEIVPEQIKDEPERVEIVKS